MGNYFPCRIYSNPFSALQTPTWPTASGITEDRARAECTAYLVDSAMAKACQNYTGDSSAMVEACVNSIQVNNKLVDSAMAKVCQNYTGDSAAIVEACINNIQVNLYLSLIR